MDLNQLHQDFPIRLTFQLKLILTLIVDWGTNNAALEKATSMQQEANATCKSNSARFFKEH